MRVSTIYTPTDTSGKVLNLSNYYTLLDLLGLVADLRKAVIAATDRPPFGVRVDDSVQITT